MRRVSASLKATRSTASAFAGGHAARSASSSTAEPSRRSSSCKSPIGVLGIVRAERIRADQLGEPRPTCAPSARAGFCPPARRAASLGEEERRLRSGQAASDDDHALHRECPYTRATAAATGPTPG